jgi:DNA-binding NtrC family response regulator
MHAQREKHSQDHSDVSKIVLVIEDDEDSANSIAEMLTFLGHKSVLENCRDVALQRLEESTFDVLLMDLRMPGMSAEVFVGEVRKRYPDIHTVLISGNANVKDITKTLKLDGSLHKPFTIDELAKVMNHKCAHT